MDRPSPRRTLSSRLFAPDDHEEPAPFPTKTHLDNLRAQRLRAVAKEQSSCSDGCTGSSAFSLDKPFVPDLLGEIMDYEEKARIGHAKAKRDAQQPLIVAESNSGTNLPQLPEKSARATENAAYKHDHAENREPERPKSTQKNRKESCQHGSDHRHHLLFRNGNHFTLPRSISSSLLCSRAETTTVTRRRGVTRKPTAGGAQHTSPNKSRPAYIRGSAPSYSKNFKMAPGKLKFDSKLIQAILNCSQATSWPKARREWRSSTPMSFRSETVHRCCCNNEIRNVYTMTNILNNYKLRFGSRCVKIFE